MQLRFEISTISNVSSKFLITFVCCKKEYLKIISWREKISPRCNLSKRLASPLHHTLRLSRKTQQNYNIYKYIYTPSHRRNVVVDRRAFSRLEIGRVDSARNRFRVKRRQEGVADFLAKRDPTGKKVERSRCIMYSRDFPLLVVPFLSPFLTAADR